MSAIVHGQRRALLLSSEQCVIARSATAPIEVRDPEGQVVGHMLSGEDYQDYAVLQRDRDGSPPTDWVERWLEYYEEEDSLDEDANVRRIPK